MLNPDLQDRPILISESFAPKEKGNGNFELYDPMNFLKISIGFEGKRSLFYMHKVNYTYSLLKYRY